MVGSHSVIINTHIRVVPAAEITTARQMALGARDVRHMTMSTHAAVTSNAQASAVQLNSGR